MLYSVDKLYSAKGHSMLLCCMMKLEDEGWRSMKGTFVSWEAN